jgi:hypothetical protein
VITVLKEMHSGGLVGHFGHDKTYAQLSSYYYWPCMRSDVKIFVERCIICQYAKGKQQNTILYQPLSIPSRPWDVIRMDFAFGLPKNSRGGMIQYL